MTGAVHGNLCDGCQLKIVEPVEVEKRVQKPFALGTQRPGPVERLLHKNLLAMNRDDPRLPMSWQTLNP